MLGNVRECSEMVGNVQEWSGMLENICEILNKNWRCMQEFWCNRKPYGKVGR